ncbi:clathrin coat assembly protein AP180 [Ricinus communis]|uniref:Clathrin assembly protein, putative n=1 Tax=Ricinus communis TaxID=3988 RepID=B9SH67_RICCO|nr:clathrin coat assembly protein AP180 [Ricinus communis]EEF37069.1 clathrin assembly protein, putative [Ricinus communis]|eukprot:XP_002525336.1 clathrin coat assembly protein AP180 [Ricinus communis]
MPSKLRKAIGAVKDQTSISLAKVYTNNPSKTNLEVVILKATRHDEAPIEERYVKEILNQISSGKGQAASCAQAIGRRIGKTRNWIVALKSLMLVLRIFQDGDPYFPREVLHAMKRGAKILNLSTFRDDSHSSPWDYTAFVRTFALYLDERLDCFLTGKLQRRFTNKNRRNIHHRNRTGTDPVCEMKPIMLLDRISFWQKLLDRAVATRPTGAAKANKLVHISLYAVVQESFDLYRDISDGLALLLDSFFHLQYQSCVSAFECCVKATRQFEELSSFYDLCKSLGVGRTSEYPSVQKISEELVETLQEFLKDQASFACNGRSPPSHLLLPSPPAKDAASSSQRYDACELYLEPTERYLGRYSERGSELSSRRTSLEDLMSITDVGTSSCTSMDRYLEQYEKQSSTDQDIISVTDSGSSRSPSPPPSLPMSTSNSMLDLVSLEDWPPEDEKDEQEQEQKNSELDSATGWEIVLVETAATQPIQALPDATNGFEPPVEFLFDNHQESTATSVTNGFEHSTANNIFDQASLPEHHYNPFLQDTLEIPTIATAAYDQRVYPIDDMFPVAPTFQAAAPTFSVQNPDGALPFPNEDDPFAPSPMTIANIHGPNGCMDQQILLQEQQLWLQNQDKIIAKHMA